MVYVFNVLIDMMTLRFTERLHLPIIYHTARQTTFFYKQESSPLVETILHTSQKSQFKHNPTRYR